MNVAMFSKLNSPTIYFAVVKVTAGIIPLVVEMINPSTKDLEVESVGVVEEHPW